ncbi:MAG: endonuclease/exonuclease/phosphatase family protein [Nitrososphaerota archaeon]|jgi:exodeoxyribonuclease-3|nr:endonuclease/exonuclease/phosphatase family protein [Nitrososphaerota archaeon]
MNILSWNINGFTKANLSTISDIVSRAEYDLILFQETKSSNVPLPLTLSSYKTINFPSKKPNYSGTLIATKEPPLSILRGIGNEEFDKDGRLITLEFDRFYVLNAYFPFAGDFLAKLESKLNFLREFERHCRELSTKKPLIICGDFNIAHQDIDRTFGDEGMPGFSLKEREWLSAFLKSGFTDSFRFLHKGVRKYSGIWYNDKSKADRLDYCLLSNELVSLLRGSDILDKVEGSDHMPIVVELRF